MDGYQDIIRRVFARYGIPNFLDRRESISHHALAELTRCSLQMVVSNWKHDDWFGALKTGLVSSDEDAIDRLENEALKRGWKGDVWLAPIIDGRAGAAIHERLRIKLISPFLSCVTACKANLSPVRSWLTHCGLLARPACRGTTSNLGTSRTKYDRLAADESVGSTMSN